MLILHKSIVDIGFQMDKTIDSSLLFSKTALFTSKQFLVVLENRFVLK